MIVGLAASLLLITYNLRSMRHTYNLYHISIKKVLLWGPQTAMLEWGRAEAFIALMSARRSVRADKMSKASAAFFVITKKSIIFAR